MPQSDWRQLDWSILTTVALVGPFEPELMCYAHSKGVRLVFGWDPGAFCPGPNGNNWMTKAMNATPEQVRLPPAPAPLPAQASLHCGGSSRFSPRAA